MYVCNGFFWSGFDCLPGVIHERCTVMAFWGFQIWLGSWHELGRYEGVRIWATCRLHAFFISLEVHAQLAFGLDSKDLVQDSPVAWTHEQRILRFRVNLGCSRV
jgi:hypothetical protein